MDEDQEVVIVDSDGTEHVFPAGFDPKHAAAIVRNHGSSALPTRPVSAEDFAQPSSGWPAKLGDLAVGAIKGLGSTVANIGETAANAGVLPGVTPAAFNADLRHPVFQRAEDATTASNTTQRVSKVAEQVGEMLLPVGAAGKAAVEAYPTVAKAGAKFQEVMGAARHIPIDVEAPGQAALKIQQLGERGATMPRAVTQFLRRVTDPEKAPMNYEEARDWASNISRLSVNDFNRMTPAIAREVAGLRVTLNKAVADAAGKAGKGIEHAQAMTEYARAKQLHQLYDTFIEGAKKNVPYFTAGGAGYYLAKKVRDLLPES